MLIYRKCNIALRLNTFDKYFRQLYQLKGDTLREINDYYTDRGLTDLENNLVPVDSSIAVQLIPVLSRYSCTICRYLTVV